MSEKTPVSILQEMYIHKGMVPHYSLIHNGGGSHDPIFKFLVTVDGCSAVGTGRAKKEAKHDAAKNLLEKIKELDNISLCEDIAEEIVNVGNIKSPYTGKLLENAIGKLQELCSTNNIPKPSYTVIADEGPPHDKRFTIQCRVNKLEETAVHRTKKQAKQMAAHFMLEKLMPSVEKLISAEKNREERQNKEDSENSEAAICKYKDIGTLLTSNKKVPIGQRISEYHLMLKDLKSTTLDFLQTLSKISDLEEDLVDVLHRLLEELKLDAEFNEVESSNDTILVILKISTTPESVLYGMGKTKPVAVLDATSNALEHFKIMTA